jgi:hypothetical protein
VHAQHIPQYPQQRAVRETVINLNVSAVHIQLHQNLPGFTVFTGRVPGG